MALRAIAVALIAVTVTACKSTDKAADQHAGSDVKPGDAATGKPSVYTLGAPAATTPAPAWAAAAIVRITAIKDDMCRCNDAACADKVTADMTAWAAQLQTNTDKPDQATTDQILQLSLETAKCKKAAGGTAVTTTADTGNTALETQGLELMDQMATVVAGNGKDCDQLAIQLEKFLADHLDVVTKVHELEKARTAAQKKLFIARNQARIAAASGKMMPTMQTCNANPRIQAIARRLAR